MNTNQNSWLHKNHNNTMNHSIPTNFYFTYQEIEQMAKELKVGYAELFEVLKKRGLTP
jgi:hypothetical protein